MNLLICLALLLIDLVLLGQVLSKCYAGYKFLRTHLPSFGSRSTEPEAPSIEEPVDSTPLKGKYDIAAFRQRILQMQKDEDGLYDIIPPQMPIKDDFTGAEIITENYEADIDRRFTL